MTDRTPPAVSESDDERTFKFAAVGQGVVTPPAAPSPSAPEE